MKSNFLIILLCLILVPARAQKIIEKHIDLSQKGSVVLNIQIADSIVVHTWNKKEVYAKASVDINDNKDNEAYRTAFDESENTVKIKAEFEKNYFTGNNCSQSTITWDIYIPENFDFSVKTINANIIIKGKTDGMKLNSISGFIDVTVSPDQKADLNFKTISGTIYSNHEIAFNPKNKEGSTKIFDKLNGGGNLIDLNTISGDIYFRK